MSESVLHPLPESIFYQTTAAGDVLPLDPLTGNPLRPGSPPESMMQDKELALGFEFWRDHGRQAEFDILLT